MTFISELPWYYLLLCFPLAGSYAWMLYRKEKHKETFGPVLLYFLSALRFFAVFILSLLLLNLLLKRNVNETEKPTLIFAFDNSASITAATDSSEIKLNYISALEKLKDQLSDKYNIRSILFGEKIIQNASPDHTDKETDFSQLLNEIDNNYSNQNIGALIISSDGIINRGITSVTPAEKFNFPIYCVGLGDTLIKKDAFLQKINHNQVVYLGNKFPVEVIIQSTKLKGKSATVSIYKDGIKKTEQTIVISSENSTQNLNFILEAEKPGVQKYSVKIDPIQEETNLNNNLADFVIDVIDTREKIVIITAAPHPDIAAIKESLESNQTYEVESYNVSNFNKPLKPYSLVILHSLSILNSNLLNEINTNNQSYFIINPKLNENLPGLKIATTFNKQNETEAVYNKNFTVFSISDELKNFIRQFPAVTTWFGNYNISPGANSLIFQKIGMVETENPILLFNENSGKKSGVFAGDGLWRWKFRDYAEHGNHNLFNELVLKTIQYLSVKADKSFFRLLTKKIVNENETIEFNAEVYNKSYQLISDPDVVVVLTDSSGKQFNYTMSKNANTYYLNAGVLAAGEYSYKSTVKVNEQVYSQSGMITVKAIIAEKTNTVANHNLLFQLSKQSGGKLFFKNDLELLRKELEENELIKPITYTQKHLNDLIDLKWIFFLVLGLLSLEWFLRKRSGSI